MRRRSQKNAGSADSFKGPAGRFNPILPRFYGLWSFSKNKPAAKSLLEFLAMRQNAEKQVAASQGYDIRPYPKFTDFKTWEDEARPRARCLTIRSRAATRRPASPARPRRR